MKKIQLFYQLYKNKNIVTKIPDILRMLKQWSTGNYKASNKWSLIIPIAILAYVISPLDVIPDFLPFIGFFDDLGLLMIAFSRLNKELGHFYAWEATKQIQ